MDNHFNIWNIQTTSRNIGRYQDAITIGFESIQVFQSLSLLKIRM